MANRWKPDLTAQDVTPEATFINRRRLMAGVAGAGVAVMGLAGMSSQTIAATPGESLKARDESPNTFEEITTYNNFYEFGTQKGDPAKYADALTTDPWTVTIDGLVDRPGDYSLTDILKEVTVEERIYRHRCVETWAMVVPWSGFGLSDLLEMAGVKSKARYVAFETLVRPKEMRGQRSRLLKWPYREGLRLDEAMNPLTLMATGLYGKPMPNQNGAPLRLVVPWKYGFKSIKSVVRITLTDMQPKTTWNELGPNEYGFFSNVNPNVDHPRWSQANERRVGGGLFSPRQVTLMFNGYEKEVGDMYKGMDLARNF